MARPGLAVLLAVTALHLSGCVQTPPEMRPIVPTSTPTGTASVEVLVLGIVDGADHEVGMATPVQVLVLGNGNGSVFVDAPQDLGDDTRASIAAAVTAAAFVARLPAARFDYAVRLPDDASLSGPSAGSQFALGFYVALNNLLSPGTPLAIRPDYAGTGTISASGSVGQVGGVPEKAQAVSRLGEGLFVYPSGAVYEDASLFARPVDMDDVCRDAGLHCVQVATLADLVEVATSPL